MTLDASYYKGQGSRNGNEREFVAIDTHQDSPHQRYVLRRLTPIECARLQGLPDDWLGIEPMKDEDYDFWLNVRNTWAQMNGKAVRFYTLEQMRKWHDSLGTDAAKFKMIGNGIALPCAEFVLSRIARALTLYNG